MKRDFEIIICKLNWLATLRPSIIDYFADQILMLDNLVYL